MPWGEIRLVHYKEFGMQDPIHGTLPEARGKAAV